MCLLLWIPTLLQIDSVYLHIPSYPYGSITLLSLSLPIFGHYNCLGNYLISRSKSFQLPHHCGLLLRQITFIYIGLTLYVIDPRTKSPTPLRCLDYYILLLFISDLLLPSQHISFIPIILMFTISISCMAFYQHVPWSLHSTCTVWPLYEWLSFFLYSTFILQEFCM